MALPLLPIDMGAELDIVWALLSAIRAGGYIRPKS